MRPARAALPDLEAVVELVGAYLVTEPGRDQLAGLGFSRDRFQLERQHRGIAEGRRCLRVRGSFSFADWFDPRPLLRQAEVPGAALEPLELLALCRFLEAVAGLRSHVAPGGDAEAGEGWPELAARAERIGDFGGLVRPLRAAVSPGGELDDNASPELARQRRQRAKQRLAIESSLGEHLRRLGGEGVLQDDWITTRNERFVLPVRADLRRKAPGVVHGASSTGQTVFVEPLETIELNNDYIRLRDQERGEVARILLELTAEVAGRSEEIGVAAAIAGELELVFAKARFAQDYQAVEAEFTADETPELELVKARHPLLVATLRGQPGRAVVPLTLGLREQRVLVISGPNTGGKTVALKTAGIAAWMAQCGLPVCAERARLPIFDEIAADVGDVQSIEQSLSTFSSHIVQLKRIVERATSRSLVVLDELGAATNAAEGAALAVAIAEFLRERQVWTLISTHHDALKAWAAGLGDVLNASVGVDGETLRPTYVFQSGVPGVSAGLAMAERLGLPEEIIRDARARMSAEELQAGEYLQRLQTAIADADRRRAEAEALVAATELRAAEVDARERALQQRDAAKARAELDRRLAGFLKAADANWQKVLEGLKDEVTNRAQRRKLELAAAGLRRETTAAFQSEFAAQLASATAAAEPAAALVAADLITGMRVRVRSMRAEGRVLRRLDEGAEVEVGHLRIRVPLADLAVAARSGGAAPSGDRRAVNLDATLAAVREINLVGLRAEEAVDKLEKFLDDTILSGAEQVRIVHGAGFGVLRKTVAEALRAHPAVASYHHPPQNQGGNGVTIAEMKG